MGKLQNGQGLYQRRLKRTVKQIDNALYSAKDDYEQALLMMQMGECQLKLGDVMEARTSLTIALEYFRAHQYRTELKKVQSLIAALDIIIN